MLALPGLGTKIVVSGCSSACVERLAWDQEDGGSNPSTLTLGKLRWVSGEPNVVTRPAGLSSRSGRSVRFRHGVFLKHFAGMLELVDIAVSDAAAERRGSSRLPARTISPSPCGRGGNKVDALVSGTSSIESSTLSDRTIFR